MSKAFCTTRKPDVLHGCVWEGQSSSVTYTGSFGEMGGGIWAETQHGWLVATAKSPALLGDG